MTPSHRLGGAATVDCDVLVIGSGAGGAIVADVLTAAGYDVVMVEEGPYVDATTAPPSVPEAISCLWRCGGLTAGLGESPVAYAEGRCVGGGTEINAAIMQRVPEELLNTWARDWQIADFGAAILSSFYDRVAIQVGMSATPGPLGEASEVLRRGSAALGWKTIHLERAQKACVGTNLCATACPTGGKQSMSVTAIPRALRRGLRLIAECRVRRLVLRRGTVMAAKASARDPDGRRQPVTIRPRHVFVCAGAIHTPALLRRSGLRHNIGNTLRLHPTVKVLARFDYNIDAHLSRLPLYAITEFMPDQRIGGSIFLPGFFGMALAEDWDIRSWLVPEWRRCGIYYTMARGKGTGKIRPVLGIAEPFVRYRLTESDWHLLAEGVFHVAQAMFAAGATHVYPSIGGHPGWTHPNQCTELVSAGLPRRSTNLMTIHLFSSCPPGEGPWGATDSFGRVRGVSNLTVADASQIPEAPGVNPQLTVMALALRSAEAYLARHERSDQRAAFHERTAL